MNSRSRLNKMYLYGLLMCLLVVSVIQLSWQGKVESVVEASTNKLMKIEQMKGVGLNLVQGTEIKKVGSSGTGKGLSMAVGEFSGDGLDDVVVGSQREGKNYLTFYQGNMDAIYPNTVEAKARKAAGTYTDVAFYAGQEIGELNVRPDFCVSGDFDNDGKWDVVVAEKGDTKLDFYQGMGGGQFVQGKSLEIGERITVVKAGDINSIDNLIDLVVGVEGKDGSKLRVYEGENGALTATPEEVKLPASATGIEIGQMNESYEKDLVVAAGNNLVMVYGRDRKITYPEEVKKEVKDAQVEVHNVGFKISGCAIGNYKGDNRYEVALLREDDGSVQIWERKEEVVRSEEKFDLKKHHAKMMKRLKEAESRKEDIVDRKVEISGKVVKPKAAIWGAGEQIGTKAINQTSLLVTGRMGSGGYDNVVIGGADGLNICLPGEEKLLNADKVAGRVAVGEKILAATSMRLNSSAVQGLVMLREGQEVPTTLIASPLITYLVTNNNDSGAGSLREAIDAANATPGPDMITFDLPADQLTIEPMTELADITETVTIDGTTQPGYVDKPIVFINGKAGGLFEGLIVLDLASSKSIIRGLSIGNCFYGGLNIIKANDCIVEGNFIGVEPDGITDANIGYIGIDVSDSSGTIIGGTSLAARNVISISRINSVLLESVFASPAGTADNKVQNNFIGVDVTGSKVLDKNSSFGGISAISVENNLIGGPSITMRNIIAGYEIGFGAGVFIPVLSDLGGKIVRDTSVIIQGNYIGTDVTGEISLPNSLGIFLGNPLAALVGGTVDGARNIIASSNSDGIRVFASGVLVENNFIGTNEKNSTVLGNGKNGILLDRGLGCIIRGNTIGNNKDAGIQLLHCKENVITGNFIGTDKTGTASLGNEVAGINVGDETDRDPTPNTGNLIGRISADSGNIIANNNGPGVLLSKTSVDTSILGNSIYDNTNSNIVYEDKTEWRAKQHLKHCQMTVGIGGRADDATATLINETGITGDVRIEFFANPSCPTSPQGKTYLGYANVTLPGTPFFQMVTDIPIKLIPGATLPTAGDKTITATLTPLDGGKNPLWTSEFTSCLMACPSTGMSPKNLPDATISGGYSQRIDVDDVVVYPATPTFSLLAGSLPPGFELARTGHLSRLGSTVAGSYTFTVMADSGTGCITTQTFSLTVKP